MTAPRERNRRVSVMAVVIWLVVLPNCAARGATVSGTAK
jgi:hypothetical protein